MRIKHANVFVLLIFDPGVLIRVSLLAFLWRKSEKIHFKFLEWYKDLTLKAN